MSKRRRGGTLNPSRRAAAEKVAGSLFLLGLAATLMHQPAGTYSWLWQETRDASHHFAVGLLDITRSSFADQWRVVEGGNHSIDLSRMIPGDARLLEATLSRGESDLDFFYKIVARVTAADHPEEQQEREETDQPDDARRAVDETRQDDATKQSDVSKRDDAPKLEDVLRIRIESGGDVVYDGLVRELHQQQPGLPHVNGTESYFSARQRTKKFAITVYLPKEGIDHQYQALAGNLEVRFLAKQATPGAIFAE